MTAPKRKIAILLSGRGSNMIALVEAARETACPYEVVLVASDKPAAPGLAWAEAQGIATWTLSPKGIGKPAYEAALDAALRQAEVAVLPNDTPDTLAARVLVAEHRLYPRTLAEFVAR